MGTETVHPYINSHTYKSLESMVLLKNDCHKRHRRDDMAFGEAFYRSSYLAKAQV